MAYGDYDGTNKPNKGQEGGACNRERCQAEPALWYNHGSYSWYCFDCAVQIGLDPVNLRSWERDWQPRVRHPQFETREMIRDREALVQVNIDDTLTAIASPYFGWPSRREKPQSESLKRILGKVKRRG